jgi:hypothetical protein
VVKPLLHPRLRQLLKEVKVVRSQSIFSRPQLTLVLGDVAQPAVEEQGTFSELEEEQQPLQALVDLATSISSVITHNSNNSAKWCNNNHKCSSPSSNKLALVTHNWHS